MADTLETLSIDLEAKTAVFEKRMAESQRILKKLRKQSGETAQGVKKMGAQFNVATKATATLAKGVGALGAALGARALVNAGRDAIEFADTIAKTAGRVGFSAQALQELRFAAELSGVALSKVDLGLQRFSRRVADAGKGMGPLARELREQQIALRDTDGQLRSSDDVLADFADAVKNAEGETEQMRLAFNAFDSEGVGLVALLRLGSEGMKEFRDLAHSSGQVIDADLLPVMERWQDRIATLEGAVRTFTVDTWAKFLAAVEEAAGLAPVNFAFGEALEADRERAEELRREIEAIGETSSKVLDRPKRAQRIRLQVELEGLEGRDPFAVQEASLAGIVELEEQRVAIEERLAAVRGNGRLPRDRRSRAQAELEGVNELIEEQQARYDAATKAVAAYNEEQTKGGSGFELQEAQLKLVEAGIKRTRTAVEVYRDTTLALDAAWGSGAFEASTESREEAVRAYSRLMAEAGERFLSASQKAETLAETSDELKAAQTEIARIFDQTRTPLEQYEIALKHLQELESKGLDADTALRAKKQLWEELQSTVEKTGDEVAKTFREGFVEAAGDVESAAELGEDSWRSAAGGIGGAIDQMVSGGKVSFRSLAASIFADIARIQARWVAMQAITKAGGFLGTVLGIGGGEAAATTSVASEPLTLTAAKGAVIATSRTVPFATGGILDHPMTFPLAGGKTGLAGEAGPEAIIPVSRSGPGFSVPAEIGGESAMLELGRLRNGDLGVTGDPAGIVAPFATGGVIEASSPVAFASGGLLTRPETFPLADGQTGLVGEAGPEAIVPVVRMGASFAIPAEFGGESVMLEIGRLRSRDLGVTGIASDGTTPFASGGIIEAARPVAFASGGILDVPPPTAFASGGVVEVEQPVVAFASGGFLGRSEDPSPIVLPPHRTQAATASSGAYAPSINVTVNHSGPASDDDSDLLAKEISRQIKTELANSWRDHARNESRPGGMLNPRLEA